MTRTEHLEWAKARAREYLAAGDTRGAVASMCSDLGKHAELRTHEGILLALQAVKFDQPYSVEHWIEGFR